MTAYIAMLKNVYANMLYRPSMIKDNWEAILSASKEITAQIYPTITLPTRESIKDVTNATFEICFVSELNEENEYDSESVLGIVSNGKITYNMMDLTEEAEDLANDSSRKEEKSSELSESATMGERNALQRAKDYLNYTAFSYSSLIAQLEFEGYSHAEACYGADYCGADWYEQAEYGAQANGY